MYLCMVPISGTYLAERGGLAKTGTGICLEESRGHDDLTGKIPGLLSYSASCCGAKRGTTSADVP